MKHAPTMYISLVFLTLDLSSVAVAAEPDFFVHFSSCKNVIAPLTPAKEPIRVLEGDPTLLACNKRGDGITCQVTFEEGKAGIKGNVGEYKINADIPPFLHFQLIIGNEYIAINTTEHAAVMSSLVLHQSYAGSKVCHGLYLTNFEFKNTRKGNQ